MYLYSVCGSTTCGRSGQSLLRQKRNDAVYVRRISVVRDFHETVAPPPLRSPSLQSAHGHRWLCTFQSTTYLVLRTVHFSSTSEARDCPLCHRRRSQIRCSLRSMPPLTLLVVLITRCQEPVRSTKTLISCIMSVGFGSEETSAFGNM